VYMNVRVRVRACVLGSSHYVAGVKELWSGHVTLLNDTSDSRKCNITFFLVFDIWPYDST
jgi:hypothetical protein